MAVQRVNSVEPEFRDPGKPKLTYSSPRFQDYGSVARLTLNGGGTASDGRGGSMTIRGSDRTIKNVIARLADHPLGIGVYLYSYQPSQQKIWGYGSFLGVLADEVETVLPVAVSVHPDGYKLVDYGILNRAAGKVVSGRPALVV